MKLSGKVAIVTGATQGIGLACAQRLVAEGAKVMLVDIKPDGEQAAAALGAAARFFAADVSQKVDVDAMVADTLAAFGRIDILINNAAFQMSHENLEDITDDEWVMTFDVNITAMFRICQRALPSMAKGSSIINTSSINSDSPKPTLLPYATTKGAIANFTAGLAQMLGSKGIRVNSVAPGPIWTPLIPATMPLEQVSEFGTQTPMGRPGQPVEVAPIYVLLGSDEASYISGSRYGVTGGKPIL